MFNGIMRWFGSRKINRTCLVYIPFFIIAFVIPAAMFPLTTQYNTEMSGFLLERGIHTDYYHLVKVCALYLSVLILLPVSVFFGRKRFRGMFVVLIPVYICLFLSTYLSEYKISAVFGVFDHYEGFLTQACYLLILVCSYAVCRGTDFACKVIKFVLWTGFAVAVAGVFQYTGIWPFVTDEPYIVSPTIGNPNYVGTYSAMLLPLSMSMLLHEEKNKSRIICLVIFFGSSFFLLLGSLSRAAFIASAVTITLFVILFTDEIRKNRLWVLSAVLYGIALFAAMNIYSGNTLVNELKSMNPLSTGSEPKLIFEDISISGNTAKLDTDKWQLNIETTEEGFVFMNERGEEIPFGFDRENGRIDIGQPYRIQAFVQEKEELKWIMLNIDRRDIEFVYSGESLKVVGFNGMLTDIGHYESVNLPFGESFASGRGYIWSRSVPLLKNAIFTGYGPDTFAYIFPQNDIVGKLNYGAIWAVIGKPHSWYLQTALGTGMVSLICLLIFFAWYGINVVKENRKKDSKSRILSFGILLSVAGYLIAGIFNDSVVSVSPVFWMLLGLGTGLIGSRPETH